MLEGDVTFVLDGTDHVRGPGNFVLVPDGASHTFGNRGAYVTRLLGLHAPAMDGYFTELELLWSGAEPPSPGDERADGQIWHASRLTSAQGN